MPLCRHVEYLLEHFGWRKLLLLFGKKLRPLSGIKSLFGAYLPRKIFLFLFLFRIIDQSSNTEIASFPLYKVLFCVRGQNGTLEWDCFAFTESLSDADEFQIHVFSCEIKEAVSRDIWVFLILKNKLVTQFCAALTHFDISWAFLSSKLYEAALYWI